MVSQYPSQYKISSIKIDGEDVKGAFVAMEVYENIFIPLVTGNLTILATDGNNFIEDQEIEFNEDFEFTISNGADERLQFSGVLNGVEGETSKENKKIYKINFVSKEMRQNDQEFISQRFKSKTPQDVIKEMIQKCGGQIDAKGAAGKPMEFISARWKPLHVVKYVLTHGVSGKSDATNQAKQQDEKAKGTTGFLCWQVIEQGQNKYRMCTVDELLKGAFDTHEPYKMKLMNRGTSTEEDMDAIVEYNFKGLGDIQTKMKSGAFKSINVSFDLDTGLYKEYEYDASQEKNLMTDKQMKIVTKPTRVLMKPYTNDKYGKTCQPEQDNTGDQSREYLAQNNARQNTFNDQTGSVTLYPQFSLHAGDIIELKINKVKSGDSQGGGSENEKHSGKYVIKQIGHHFNVAGQAYTKVTTIRSTKQQDKQTANQG